MGGCAAQTASTDELPPLTEVIERADRAWKTQPTVHATVREWQHFARSVRAGERALARQEALFKKAAVAGSGAFGGVSSSEFAILTGSATGPAPETRESVRGIWRAPGLLRLESGATDERTLLVQNGSDRLTLTSDVGAITESRPSDPDDAAGYDEETHDETLGLPIYAAGLDQTFDSKLVGAERILGRLAAVVRAIPKTDRDPFAEFPTSFGTFDEPEEMELAIDVETGLVLRREDRVDGEPYARAEVTELELDVVAPAETFSVLPPEGVAVHTQADLEPKELSFTAAAAAVPFTLWAPPDAARGNQVTVWPEALGPQRVHLTTGFESEPREVQTIAEQAADLAPNIASDVPPGFTRRTVQRDGIAFDVLERSGAVNVTFVRDGTQIAIGGDNAETLIDAGLALRPVPRP